MKYRSRLDIVALLLRGAASGVHTKTKLMYLAYVSHAQLEEYLVFLVSKGCLTRSESGKPWAGQLSSPYFTITEKGRGVVAKYDELMEIMSGLDTETPV